MKQLLYGAAYYFEYLPYDRIDQDIEMMKAAGINVVRIGESTWSTYEPHDGEFDFSKLIYTLDKMDKNGMKVIVGTPTYAFPTWLAKEYPDVLVERQEIVCHMVLVRLWTLPIRLSVFMLSESFVK